LGQQAIADGSKSAFLLKQIDMKKEFTNKHALVQSEIIGQWVKEAAKAYSVNEIDLKDGQIISYLAQKQMGFHSELSITNDKNKRLKK
jgi:hypothetical protein